MSLWRKFLNNLPRPSLLWMSYNDVLRVRNQLAALCFPRGDFLSMPFGKGIWGDVYPGLVPMFRLPLVGREGRSNVMALKNNDPTPLTLDMWLKVPSGKMPQWDISVNGGPVHTYDFNSVNALAGSIKIKEWSRKFSLQPHPGSLTHKGEFLA